MAKRKRKHTRTEAIEPTAQRFARNAMERAGMAYRVTAPIRQMFDRDQLTPSQFDNLSFYRQQAQQAQDDESEMSPMHPAKAMGGAGGSVAGSTVPASLLRATPAQIETSRIERDVLAYGQTMLDLLRFVARDDQTLAQWCIQQHGGRERYDGDGKFIAVVPISEKRVMERALLDLKFIAGTIVR